MSDPTLELADTLHRWIQLSVPLPRHDFVVGVGPDRFHVFCGCGVREWSGEHTPRWSGFPVTWHFLKDASIDIKGAHE